MQGNPVIPEAGPALREDLERGIGGLTNRPRLIVDGGDGTDQDFQQAVLPGVSRTFALTIPKLPAELVHVVTNAYLLCRIADTIEDESTLAHERKRELHRAFVRVVEGEADAYAFADEVLPLLSDGTLAAERELVRNTARIVQITEGLRERQRAALTRCVRIMCEGMGAFPGAWHQRGLRDVAEWREYCYYVAGVVGEMLTELFCDYSPAIEAKRAELERRAVSFGQGLQMINILRDIWTDHEQGACWLPRDVFEAQGFDLRNLPPNGQAQEFAAGLEQLVAIAHGHLRDALDYTLLIPAREAGIRHFCLWGLGMALLTLRKVHGQRVSRSSGAAKIKRFTVRATNATAAAMAGNDRALQLLFRFVATGLPRPSRA